MKDITGLNDPLEILGPKDIAPTLRDVIVESVGRAPVDGKDAFRAYQLCEKMKADGDKIQIEDDEAIFIRECLELNPARFFPFYLGQALEKFNG